MGEVDPAFIQATEHRPKLDTIEAGGIPLIDLSVSDSRDIKELVSEIGNVCKRRGFFQVINHGVPLELSTRIKKAVKTFFDQPMEEKLKVKRDELNAMETGRRSLIYCYKIQLLSLLRLSLRIKK
ncbi:hypothetical protein CRYUN_Cryun06bG0046500 [Craigia yunnanensis]